jgi:hypothetical protein
MRSDATNARGPARRLWPAYFLAVLGAAAILAGLGWEAIRDRPTVPSRAENAALGLPRQLVGRPASGQQTGQDALTAIASLHGKGFALKDGAVAHFGEATVWVAQTRDETGARAMTDAMTQRIAAGGSPFTPADRRQVSGRTVYVLSGMGQTHFYWQAADKVVWLAIDPIAAESGLRELIEAIR